MTDLQTRPVSREVTLAETIRTAPCLTDAQRRWWPESASNPDSAPSIRRALAGLYLRAREAHEDDPTVETAGRMADVASLLARALTVTGEATSMVEAHRMIDAVAVPEMAERVVEYWADREMVLWDLDTAAVCAVADSVRDWVADGGELNQMPMRAWVNPYLAVRR